MSWWLFLLVISLCSGKRIEFATNQDSACDSIGKFPNVCNEWIHEAGSVEMDCTFQFRIGLWDDDTSPDEGRVGPSLILRYANGNTQILEPHYHSAILSFQENYTPIICEHNRRPNFISPTDLTGSKDFPGPVLLFVTSSIEYLWKLWPYFIQKVLWAESVNMRLALWIGELPLGVQNSISKECYHSKGMQTRIQSDIHHHLSFVIHDDRNNTRRLTSFYQNRFDSKKYHNTTLNSNHYIKMLATYAILRFSSPKPGGVYYVDLDSIVANNTYKFGGFGNRRGAHVMAQVHLNDKKDVYFYQIHHGANTIHGEAPGPMWLVKGHHYYIRNTVFGRRFILAWLHWRCGFKDQIAVWHTIAKLADSAGCLPSPYNDDIFKFDYWNFYQDAEKLKLWLPDHINVDRRECRQQCPDFLFDCSTEKFQFKEHPLSRRNVK